MAELARSLTRVSKAKVDPEILMSLGNGCLPDSVMKFCSNGYGVDIPTPCESPRARPTAFGPGAPVRGVA